MNPLYELFPASSLFMRGLWRVGIAITAKWQERTEAVLATCLSPGGQRFFVAWCRVPDMCCQWLASNGGNRIRYTDTQYRARLRLHEERYPTGAFEIQFGEVSYIVNKVSANPCGSLCSSCYETEKH